MTTSCSHWWHAPFYFGMSITMAVIITTTFNSNPTQSSSSPFPMHDLSFNASKALRARGFNSLATLLHISPELFLSQPQSTIFAVQDVAIANASFPPWVLRQLLKYHTTPIKLSFQELLTKPQNTCLETLLRPKKTVITESDAKQRSLQINNVLITHPDIFLEGPISIHGVLSPFASTNHQISQDWDIIESPICDSSSGTTHNEPNRSIIEWARIVQLLSSKGYVPFPIGLDSVYQEIVQDYGDLTSVTVLAPPDLAVLSSSSPLLQRIVRFHMLPQRFSFSEFSTLSENTTLNTLLLNKDLHHFKFQFVPNFSH